MDRIDDFVAERLWLQVVLSALLAPALIMVISPGESPAAVLLRVGAATVTGAFVVAARQRKERRATGATATGVRSLERRLRSGEPPTDPAERSAMRRLVDERLHRTRHAAAALVGLSLMFAAVAVLAAVTAGARQGFGFAVFTVVFVGWLSRYGSLQRRRLRAMREALGPAAGPGPDTEGGAGRAVPPA
ncbi:hypothetical protein [uncultured Streptomyces sp.]|uniref:hypothetical protein n=1 Tax=uncultured Streptomyces sp. TaxID=174707 RepID=UPI002614474D|nr:hypothetical protein [uncultured Streptomyces sp.]